MMTKTRVLAFAVLFVAATFGGSAVAEDWAHQAQDSSQHDQAKPHRKKRKGAKKGGKKKRRSANGHSNGV